MRLRPEQRACRTAGNVRPAVGETPGQAAGSLRCRVGMVHHPSHRLCQSPVKADCARPRPPLSMCDKRAHRTL